ncbi:hypothetical protein RRG08_005795 [Elysia crispata]|uniref:Uncharacterized protein n=1 Tax=Elysia crispata TaxID=231223 RepID=A0AAE1DNS9_9GAST|nr:hypothetical protein RRG08_005795 [Elysia crispata]
MGLDLNTLMALVHRAICGILTCEESFTSDSSNTSTKYTSHHRTISSIRTFKISQTKPRDVINNDEDKRMITELTLDQPRIARVTDGVKAFFRPRELHCS